MRFEKSDAKAHRNEFGSIAPQVQHTSNLNGQQEICHPYAVPPSTLTQQSYLTETFVDEDPELMIQCMSDSYYPEYESSALSRPTNPLFLTLDKLDASRDNSPQYRTPRSSPLRSLRSSNVCTPLATPSPRGRSSFPFHHCMRSPPHLIGTVPHLAKCKSKDIKTVQTSNKSELQTQFEKLQVRSSDSRAISLCTSTSSSSSSCHIVRPVLKDVTNLSHDMSQNRPQPKYQTRPQNRPHNKALSASAISSSEKKNIRPASAHARSLEPLLPADCLFSVCVSKKSTAQSNNKHLVSHMSTAIPKQAVRPNQRTTAPLVHSARKTRQLLL